MKRFGKKLTKLLTMFGKEKTKMPKFNVEISDNAYYPDIEAENEEAAMYIAVGWWMERNPDIHCEEVDEEVDEND